MSISDLSPKLPSGQQMIRDDLPAAVQEQLRSVAVEVLQRLFAPILHVHRLRQARRAVNQRLLSSHASWEEVEAAAFDALQYTSFFGAVLHDPHSVTADGRPLATGSAAAEVQGGAMAALPAESAVGAEVRSKVRDVLRSSHVQVSVHLHGEFLEWELEPASEVLVLVGGTLRRCGVAVAVGGGANVGSPTTGCALLRKDSVVNAGAGLPVAGRRSSAVMPRSRSSRLSSASGSPAIRPNATFARRLSTGSGQEPAASVTGTADTAGALSMRSSSALQAPQLAALSADAEAEWLTAPQVLGELECVGGFPYCATLSVSSPMAIVLRIPKAVYCHMLCECVPSGGQRRLLTEALQTRERLLPYFAPLTQARLRMCPLLTRLHAEQLEHIRELMLPRVYAAGMECCEKERPRHIFFIRRGVVQMQRKASVLSSGGGGTHSNISEPASRLTAADDAASHTSFPLEYPKNRLVLVEGHTYGETSCIFDDTVGEHYMAVTHVDMYLLPFQVLIQLMKQEPEVHSVVYRSAKELSFLRDKEWPGVLFGPRLVGTELPGVHGVVPAGGVLALMAAGAHDEVAGGADGGGGAGGWRRGGCLAEVGIGVDSPPHGNAVRGGSVGNRCSGPARRVTIFEEASSSCGMGDRGGGVGRVGPSRLTGGRVSSALLSAMERLPLVGLCPGVPSDFYRACLQHWQCVRYKKGDVIVSCGKECNGLLLFFEGRAGVVMNAALLRREKQPGSFCRAGIASAPLGGIVRPIPPGHVVGYTCVRRHRWSRSIVALDDVVEVWEMRRNAFVQLLRAHGIEHNMQVATLQVLQPLAAQEERLAVLDHQPLLHPMPSSLWSEQGVPNVHPVVVSDGETVCFPVWLEGDFPLDSLRSSSDTTARISNAGGRRATLSSLNSMRVAPAGSELQRSVSRLEDSFHVRARRPGSVVGFSE
ncbi:hypothetical protein JKF63_02617 [Porcisia hertigi]|uniref:Cyclic nucleotide-binding domain-containing protein n=1 Tax=Porcisia hertigi TaxID=2761500 RepID=A0A836IIX6_9TRYP|nr:hypothetical protein JKF63_02617 [Porcisia hertigi]